MIPNVATVFAKLNPSKDIENHRADKRRAIKNGIRWCILQKKIQTSKVVKSDPGKVTAIAICPIFVPFITQRALDLWRRVWTCVHSKDEQKQLARMCTFCIFPIQCYLRNLQRNQLSIGLIAQSEKHCTTIVEILGSNPEFCFRLY